MVSSMSNQAKPTQQKAIRKANPKGPVSPNDASSYFDHCTTQVFLGHSKTVRTVAWSFDGLRLASGSVDKTVRLWEPEQPTRSDRLTGHTESVDQLCWSPVTNYLLATASVDKSVRFWDTRVGRCVHVTPTTGENINIAWSGDGKAVAVGDKDDKITFIDTRVTEKGTRDFKIISERKERPDKRDEINEIGWSLDCQYFFITTGSGAIKIFNWPTMEYHKEVKSHSANCYCIDFDPKGKRWATGGADALVCLYNSELIGLGSFDSLQFPVRTLSFTHDGVYLASASEDEHIIITNVQTQKEAYRIPTKAATNSVAWNPHNYLLAFAGDETTGAPENRYVGLKVFGYN